MYDKEWENLELISKYIGSRTEFVQGGGGNTSAKLNGKLMAVKASGYKLSQVTSKQGYAIIDYQNIREYFDKLNHEYIKDYEKEGADLLKRNTVQIDGIMPCRPSVEAGFHSLLDRYVIHTHSVYSNILCCSDEGEEVMDNILSGKGISYCWIPYVNPGFELTKAIKGAIELYIEKQDKFPQVFFLENHGMIVNADDCKDCIDMHSEVNRLIKDYLGIREEYPEISLEKIDEYTYKSTTPYVARCMTDICTGRPFFSEIVLYPDQIVYLNSNFSLNDGDAKVSINKMTGEILYNTSFIEALTIEETLLAYVYVVSKIKEFSFEIKTMSNKEVEFIQNWESEKYRKKVLSNI